MSLRCVGARNVRTAPNAVLDGATTASVSVWVQVNAGSGIPAGDAQVMGKSNGDPWSLSIVGGTATTLRARWYANNGGTETGSSCEVVLASGAATHLAMTYAPGVQQYFVNGVLVGTDTCASPLGRPADNHAPQYFQVGPTVAGLDVSLDEPTIWNGYALTQTDINNLLNRVVHPNGIAASQIVWGLSLTGNDGASAAVGDSGLADFSASGQSVTAISTPAPAYQGGVLTYTPSVWPKYIKLGPSNQTIVCSFMDANGNDAPFVSLTGSITQAVQVTGASGTFALTVNGQKTAPIAIGADAGTVQAAVAALSGIGSGNIQVQGLTPYLFSGIGTLAGQTLAISLDASGVSSTFATVPGPDTAPGSGSPATVANTDSGCVFTGNWTKTTNTGGSAGILFTSDPPGPLSPSLATYTFPGLAPGTYEIQAVWPASPTNATRAPYRVYDGTTLRAMTLVDQTQAPGIQVYNSFPRSTIARVYCAGGTIRVVLANDADAAVLADAVVVVPVTGTATYQVVDDGPNPSWTNLINSGPYFLYNLSGSECVLSGTGWQSSGLDNYDFHSSHHAVLAGTGANTATWIARMLAPGTYDIQASWAANAANASNATYQVFDGSTLLGSVAINQQTAPKGGVSDSSTGYAVAFQSLGSFTINSGTARVVLSDNANGTVVADATLFRPTGTTPLIGTPPIQTIPVSSSFQSFGGTPTISVNGGAPIALTLPLTGPDYVYYPLTAAVPANATVTFSAPSSWALTTAGAVPALSAYPVTTGVTSFLPAFNASTPKTMGIGYVVLDVGYDHIVPVYADLMKQASDWNGTGTFDADGWPLTTQANGISCVVSQPPPNGFDGNGIPNLPWGSYTIVWDTPDGTGNCSLSSAGDDVFAEDTSGRANLTATTTRTRVFTYTNSKSGMNAPTLSCNASGNCRNIRIYPPGVATDGSQFFNPSYLAMLAGITSFRMENFVQVNTAVEVNYADFPTTTARTYCANYGWPSAPIASVRGATAAEGNFGFFTGTALFVVTTTVPHNLTTGQVVTFNNLASGGLITLASGVQWGLNSFGPTIYVISSTTFAASIPSSTTVTGTLGAGGFVYLPKGGAPPEHAVALANAVPGAMLHFNVPQALSDAAATTLFQMIAANYDKTRTLIVELSNEPWNHSYPYEQSAYFGYLGVQRGLNNTQAYVQRASEIAAIARTAFTAAGRPLSQLKLALNTIAVPGNVNAILAYAAAPTDPRAGGKPIAIDYLMTAPYWKYNGAAVDPRYNFLTIDMVMDILELSLPGQNAGPFSSLRSWLDAAGFHSTQVMAYEGGPATLFINGDVPHLTYQSQGANLHPRLYNLGLYMWQEAQDASCVIFSRKQVVDSLSSDVGTAGAACYSTYYAYAPKNVSNTGLNTMADDHAALAVNMPVLSTIVPGTKAPDYTAMVSPLGRSISRWNALRASPPAVQHPPKKPIQTRAAEPRRSRGRAR